jgi:hypothetical protein
MCDLWRYTIAEEMPPGAIVGQIRQVLDRLAAGGSAVPTVLPDGSAPAPPSDGRVSPARQIKLYNGGSFFDRRAIPPEDYPAIARLVASFERVIVECHPALVGKHCLEFHALLAELAPRASASTPMLEVAMGLETVHPEVLERLNKGMTLEQFRQAADVLRNHGIALRAFILVKPPFLDEAAAFHWAARSLDFAFDSGAGVAVLIPTRLGNGALEALAACGDFAAPRLATLEAALEYGIGLCRGRVFADLWDLARFADCSACFGARAERLRLMNRRQSLLPPVTCEACGSGDGRPPSTAP